MVFKCPRCGEAQNDYGRLMSHLDRIHNQSSDETLVGKIETKLAAIGINLEPKTLSDVQAEHKVKQNKYMNTPKKKPEQVDYQKIISAQLDELKLNLAEAKIAIKHKHRIIWRGAKLANHEPSKLVEGKVGKYAKIWLLKANQQNGNGWGVAPETIDKNIRFFVGRPYVITAKEWIPQTAYSTYDHPYLPTNDLYSVLRHQEPYRVGTIKDIQKEGDDYYAIIEVNQRFANRQLPAFCSPAVFQVDPFEPENRITKWIPLHLAGLDQSPAYGARIAILKGTCVGTSTACSIQLKTAKLYDTGIVCPASVSAKLQKLGAIGIDVTMEKTKRLEKIRNYYDKTPSARDRMDSGETVDILEEREKNKEYIESGKKVRPLKPLNADRARIISAKEEGHISLDKDIIPWWNEMNVSRRQHAIDPNRHDNEATLKMSGKDWDNLEPNEKRFAIVGYSFRHKEADMGNLLPYDPKESPENRWNILTPSMRHHIIDPHQILGKRDMVMKEYKDLEGGERSEVDGLFDLKDKDESSNLTKSAKIFQIRALMASEYKDLPLLSQRESGYVEVPPTGPRCNLCIYFDQPDKCYRVEGKIDGEYGCCNIFKGEEDGLKMAKVKEILAGDEKHLNGEQPINTQDRENAEGDQIYGKKRLLWDKFFIQHPDKYIDDRRFKPMRFPDEAEAVRELDLVQKIAALETHPGTDKIEKKLKRRTDDIHNHIPSRPSMFLSKDGQFLGDGTEHHQVLKELGPLVGVHSTDSFDNRAMHEFLHKTGMIRVQSFPRKQKYSFHIVHQPTPNQIKTISDIEETNPNAEIGHAIQTSPDKEPDVGTGTVRDLIGKIGRKFHGAKIDDKLQKLAIVKIPPVHEVINAFHNKQSMKGRNHETDGKSYFLFNHKIAEHSPNGMKVSNAGYDTPTTYNTLKKIGINVETKEGVPHINDKPYPKEKHGSFVTVPYKNVHEKQEHEIKRIDVESRESRPFGDNASLQLHRNWAQKVKQSIPSTEMKEHGEKVKKNEVGLSATAIQPEHQKIINKITGIKSKIPRETLGTAAHHVLYKERFPGLAYNRNNGVPISTTEHSELHRLNPHSIQGAKEIEEKLQLLARDVPIFFRGVDKVKHGDTLSVKKGTNGKNIYHAQGNPIFEDFTKDIGTNDKFSVIKDSVEGRDRVRLQKLSREEFSPYCPDCGIRHEAGKHIETPNNIDSNIMKEGKINSIKQRLAELDDDDNTTYQKSKHLKIISHKNAEKPLRQRLAKSIVPLGSGIIDKEGKIVGLGEGKEHRHLAGPYFDKDPDDTHSEDVDKYFEETGHIRLYHPHPDRVTVGVYAKPTSSQIRAMKDIDTFHEDHQKLFYDAGGGDARTFNEFRRNSSHFKAASLEERLQRLAIIEPPKVNINPEHGKKIANAYGQMKHEPNNPDVKSAYGALIKETGEQFKSLTSKGLKIDQIKDTNPYENSKSMHDDIEKNNHLSYYPTEKGFGQGENNKDHPMLQPTEFKHEGKPMLANDVFRIVHDINGHHAGGNTGFGPKGEHQAYLTHKKMYTPLAHKALFTETAAQNNYVNFGPNGEHNRKDPKNTIYAPQKAGIMPEHILNGKFHI